MAFSVREQEKLTVKWIITKLLQENLAGILNPGCQQAREVSWVKQHLMCNLNTSRQVQ